MRESFAWDRQAGAGAITAARNTALQFTQANEGFDLEEEFGGWSAGRIGTVGIFPVDR
jgi:hypothetical protein